MRAGGSRTAQRTPPCGRGRWGAHHAEHLADVPGKRVVRHEVPFATPDGVRWRTVEEFDTADPVLDGLADDYFATIVTDFVATGQGVQGPVGEAPGLLVDAAAMCAFAVRWIERAAPSSHPAP